MTRVQEHVDAFNDAVASGDWPRFADRFAPDAAMSFVGVPVGPFAGRDAIADAYAQQPPTEPMAVRSVQSDSDSDTDTDTVAFAWQSGATGTMVLRWDRDLVAELVVSFDS